MLTIEWTDAAAALPDDDVLVLLALNDDDVWRYVDAMPITVERVTHWMPLPAAPSTADSANTGALGEKGAEA